MTPSQIQPVSPRGGPLLDHRRGSNRPGRAGWPGCGSAAPGARHPVGPVHLCTPPVQVAHAGCHPRRHRGERGGHPVPQARVQGHRHHLHRAAAGRRRTDPRRRTAAVVRVARTAHDRRGARQRGHHPAAVPAPRRATRTRWCSRISRLAEKFATGNYELQVDEAGQGVDPHLGTGRRSRERHGGRFDRPEGRVPLGSAAPRPEAGPDDRVRGHHAARGGAEAAVQTSPPSSTTRSRRTSSDSRSRARTRQRPPPS